jgi:hypothetical protein
LACRSQAQTFRAETFARTEEFIERLVGARVKIGQILVQSHRASRDPGHYLVMENNIEKRTVNLQSVRSIVNHAQLSEFVHKKIDS